MALPYYVVGCDCDIALNFLTVSCTYCAMRSLSGWSSVFQLGVFLHIEVLGRRQHYLGKWQFYLFMLQLVEWYVIMFIAFYCFTFSWVLEIIRIALWWPLKMLGTDCFISRLNICSENDEIHQKPRHFDGKIRLLYVCSFCLYNLLLIHLISFRFQFLALIPEMV